jgi:cytochrome oxidase Cu insertion factor (SCO1/SenC/PrrC family)
VFRRIPNLLARSAAFAAILCFASAPAFAGNASADRAAAEAKARDYFSNVELIDQDGRPLKFYDEVLKDNIVVISFIFTNCQSACPLMTRNLTMIRDMLREDERRAIQFVSISIDPLRDTPAAMKEFAQKHDADNGGWLWLTGQPERAERALDQD